MKVITCSGCANSYPYVLNCETCHGSGKELIFEPPKGINWARLGAWLLVGGIGIAAFLIGWFRH